MKDYLYTPKKESYGASSISIQASNEDIARVFLNRIVSNFKDWELEGVQE